MKWLIVLTVLLSLFISSPCYSLNLESSNLFDNIIKSLDEERDKWIIRNSSMYYINRHIDPELRDSSWPEYDDDCLVEMDFQIMRGNNCYISFDKPLDKMFSGKELPPKFLNKIRQVVYEELHNRYKISLPKKEIVLPNVKKEEIKKEAVVDKDGLKPL